MQIVYLNILICLLNRLIFIDKYQSIFISIILSIFLYIKYFVVYNNSSKPLPYNIENFNNTSETTSSTGNNNNNSNNSNYSSDSNTKAGVGAAIGSIFSGLKGIRRAGPIGIATKYGLDGYKQFLLMKKLELDLMIYRKILENILKIVLIIFYFVQSNLPLDFPKPPKITSALEDHVITKIFEGSNNIDPTTLDTILLNSLINMHNTINNTILVFNLLIIYLLLLGIIEYLIVSRIDYIFSWNLFKKDIWYIKYTKQFIFRISKSSKYFLLFPWVFQIY